MFFVIIATMKLFNVLQKSSSYVFHRLVQDFKEIVGYTPDMLQVPVNEPLDLPLAKVQESPLSITFNQLLADYNLVSTKKIPEGFITVYSHKGESNSYTILIEYSNGTELNLLDLTGNSLLYYSPSGSCSREMERGEFEISKAIILDHLEDGDPAKNMFKAKESKLESLFRA